MTYNYPFFSFPHFRRYPNYYHAQYPYEQRPSGTNYTSTGGKEPNNKQQPPQPKEHQKEDNPPKARSSSLGLLNNIFHQEDRDEDEDFFELLGLKLYNDDILLLGLIFFLYKEDVKDQYLFFALILLLLS